MKAPPGSYPLVQAGKQLEHIAGGLIEAGFHEGVGNEATTQVIEKTKSQGTRLLIRISSRFFKHLSSDYDLEPIQSLQSLAAEVHQQTREDESEVQIYDKMKVGTQVQNELKHTALVT
ncbi:hypothetical protein M407DRAFT_24133 [Tulasnella calospora MUT 4182]|uniref:Uncharacterized protein n=1 Tax=Tulasnella calospora MUT 4182 TaxID=1051891 RepID=A0A0C3LYM1_9AGAM|nr:hypothetical protein M407DRAFT_24133 [Tulasnella calospora MUT 4182]